MADTLVERRPAHRFFCHRCNIEFEDDLQEFTCPFCASGFIEQLEAEADGLPGDDFSDADMSNIDDMSNLDGPDDFSPGASPVLNDLAFLMSGGRIRRAGRRDTLMDQLVWMIGGARPTAGVVTAGAPVVLVGAPGDYVFGGEGLDAVVTQLLGQLENSGPPPLPRQQIAELASVVITEEQAAMSMSCSVCWENFISGETVSRLECTHIFHSNCITPWLELHATCPICRRSLLPDAPLSATTVPIPNLSARSSTHTSLGTSLSQLLARRVPRRRAPAESADSSSSSASVVSSSSSVTASGQWAPSNANTNSSPSNSSTSLNSNERERQYNMDIDFD